MIENITIITDEKRNINYSSVLSFYKLKVFDENYDINHIKISKLVIVDLDYNKSLNIINQIREEIQGINIIMINDYDINTRKEPLKEINGYGKISIIYWKKGSLNLIAERVQSMIYPEYPSKNTSIVLVVPVYNEEERMEHVYNFAKKVKKIIEESFLNMSIYFVNDGSLDNTQKLIDRFVKEDFNNSKYIHKNPFMKSKQLEENTRKAGTYIEGIRSLHADIYVFADADDSFSIDDIAKMINILEMGYYEIVLGTKDLTAENRDIARKFISFCKRMLTKPFLPKGVMDSQTGLKAFNGNAAKYIFPYLNPKRGLAIDLEMVYLAKKLNFRVLQLPVKCIDREGSSIDILKDSVKYLTDMVKIYMENRNVKY
ncbi:glycosyltransferase [Peptostreptococcaceae bacterium AGR-M142]